MLSLSSDIVIEAPTDAVWALLTDFSRYAEWNPFLPYASGEAKTGTSLDVVIAPPGMRRNHYRLTVTAVETERRLCWLGHLLFPGLMDGDHAFEIERLGRERTRVIQREDFTGYLVPMLRPWLRSGIGAGFEVMNRALQERAERLFGIAAHESASAAGFHLT
jgi:hypothetical protein